MPKEEQPTPPGSPGPEELLRLQSAELASLRALVAELPQDLDQLQQDAARWREIGPRLPELRQQIEAGLDQERQQLEQQRQGIEASRRRLLIEQSALAGGVREEWLSDFCDRFDASFQVENGRAVMVVDGEAHPAGMAVRGLIDRPEYSRFAFMFGPRMGSGSGGSGVRSSGTRINPGSAEWQQLSPAAKLSAVFGTVPPRTK